MSGYLYQDPRLPAQQRAKDLLSRMTLEEKVCQLGCVLTIKNKATPEELDVVGGIGEVAVMVGGPTAHDTALYVQALQQHVIEQSPHGIPALFHCEALSGPVMPECLQFPTSIGLGAACNPDMVRDMAQRIKQHLLALGFRHALSPVLDVARDMRWGRVAETYGGDPTLDAAMSCAFVDGLQDADMANGVAATGKHFLGYAQSEGGLNKARTMADARELREIFAKPFEAAIHHSRLRTVMNSYSEINGKPACASREILDTLLRKELGFDGLVVGDYMTIPRLVSVFKTAETVTDAGIQCLEAGLDLELPVRLGYGDGLIAAAKDDRIAEGTIDRSVERVLRLKFELGLFENPYPRWEQLADCFAPAAREEHEAASLEAARQTMTLVKNNGILPLTDKTQRIAVIGPSGDSLRIFYAGYTYCAMKEMLINPADMAGLATEEEKTAALQARFQNMDETDAGLRAARPGIQTLFEALRDRFDTVSYTQGCYHHTSKNADLQGAKEAAQAADIVVLCVCGKNGWGNYSSTSGEGLDSACLELPGAQEELMRCVFEANPNVVLVHTNGRPLASQWAYDHIPAILEGWLPCTWGGVAIAQTLCGEHNPAGRMPVDAPRTSGHTPYSHYQHQGSGGPDFIKDGSNSDGYVDIPIGPLCPFGFGLSYTQFAYSGFAVIREETGKISASVRVKNTGAVAGGEVVQLYGADSLASFVRPLQELIGFRRIYLEAGQEAVVSFSFNLDFFAFAGDDGVWRLEPGAFELWVGRHSADKALTQTVTLETGRAVMPGARCFFFAQAQVQTQHTQAGK